MSYAPQAPMTVQSGGNRNAKNLPTGNGGREWSNGICGCCDAPGMCVLATCCPCIAYGQVKQRHQHLQDQGTVLQNPDCVSGDCCFFGVLELCGVSCLLQMFTRSSVRMRYNIAGGGFSDCCTAYCCQPCEIVQEHMEIQLEEQSLGQQKQ